MRRVATAPISWGVCEVPGWGHQLPPDRVLAEMRSLGFTHTELGSAGWLPDDSEGLKLILGRHDLSLLAAFIPLVLHDVDRTESALAEARAAAKLLSACGAVYFNTAPVTSHDWEPRRPLTDGQWRHLYTMIARVEEICVEHGLIQVIHEHYGCVVETADEVRGLLANTEAALVVDTGHLAIGGYSPLELVEEHPDRVGLVHLKDTRLDVADRLNRRELSLMEAVQAGLFPALGLGDLAMGEFISTLEAAGYDGWYVIEQDCAITGDAPAEGDGPIRDVATSVAFLRDIASALRASPSVPARPVV